MTGARDDLPSLFESIPIPTYVFRAVDDEFVLERVNAAVRAEHPEVTRLYGHAMGRLYRDQPHVLDAARRCVAARGTVDEVATVRRYDRTEATQRLLLTFSFVEPAWVVIYARDVAEPEVAQAAVRESEARYRSLVASLPDAVILRGADGRVLACNEVAVRLFGASAEAEILGRREFLPDGWRVERESGEAIALDEFPCMRALATGEPDLARVLSFVTPGAPPRWLRVSAQPIASASGAVTGCVSIFVDVTDHVLAQRALQESATRLALALDAGRMGAWDYDLTTRVGGWSSSLDAVFFLPPCPRGIPDYLAAVHPEDRDAVARLADRLSAGRDGDAFEHEHRIVGADGVTRWAHLHGRVSGAPGRLRYLGTIMDVTEHHRLQDELHRASRLESIGRLAGGVAHDFNNLLAAMLGSLELVEEVAPPEARDDLATVRHGAERARDLTRQMLAFAKKQPVELKPVDLSVLVRRVERMLRRLVGPSVMLALEVEPGVVVRADAAQVEQVLVNLVVNARDAMPDGGRLAVRVDGASPGPEAARGDGAFARLEVVDTGTGMDDDTRRQLFDPFFTTKVAGTGLGLASTYGIVQQHGGYIEVDSAPGVGATFRVFLPRVEARRALTPPPAAVKPAPAGCVLVVDDEEMVRRTAVRLLERLGYQVLSANGGEAALALSSGHQGRIDVLLCDVAMPGQSGPVVAAALKAQRPEMRVIFVSGYADSDVSSAVEGAAFLQKPYSRADLDRALAT